MNKLETLVKTGLSERKLKEAIADFLNGEIVMALEWIGETIDDTESPAHDVILGEEDVVDLMQKVLSKLKIDVTSVVEEVLEEEWKRKKTEQ